jgi:hypothetical protein
MANELRSRKTVPQPGGDPDAKEQPTPPTARSNLPPGLAASVLFDFSSASTLCLGTFGRSNDAFSDSWYGVWRLLFVRNFFFPVLCPSRLTIISFQKCSHLRAAAGDESEDRQARFLVCSFYELTRHNGRLGSALTFTQMLFIATQALPTFLTFTPFPTLRPRHIPIHAWLYQVLIITSTGLLNNWAYAFNVPFTILIVFRSAGRFPLSFHWPHI